MGISTGNFSRPAKFSTIIADADLDIGARAILSTNLSLFEMNINTWGIYNRAKAVYKNLIGETFNVESNILVDTIGERSAGGGIIVDGLLIKDDKIQEMDGIGGEVMPKIVSDNLRNSHDAEVSGQTGAVYVKQKTMTFTNGVKGTLRIKFDRKVNNATYFIYGAVYKNGVLIGTPDGGNDTAYTNFSEDIDVGTIAAGETLELWLKAEHVSSIGYLQNFRCYYDDDSGISVSVNS
jgi:hypothetical protein